MPKIAVIGGTGYLASIIKNQNNSKKNKYFFFSRKKNSKNFINFSNNGNYQQLLKKFHLIVHLAGSNKSQIEKKKGLIKLKNNITTKICDICINHNIKLIYISSMQVYKNYGNKDINKNSIIDHKNLYARSHYESEKIILKKLKKYNRTFTILRLGNVFGYLEKFDLKKFSKNIIHDFCKSALDKQRLIVKNGTIQRQFIPSQIFIKIINTTINKKIFNNSVSNVGYKVFNLKEISSIIRERYKKIYNKSIDLKINNFKQKRKNLIILNKNYKFKFDRRKINFEIEKVLTNIKRN